MVSGVSHFRMTVMVTSRDLKGQGHGPDMFGCKYFEER